MGKSHFTKPTLTMSTIIRYIKILMMFSKTIQQVLTLQMYFSYFYLHPKIQGRTLETLGPKLLG